MAFPAFVADAFELCYLGNDLCSLLMIGGCHKTRQPLSPCRAQVFKKAEQYLSQGIPESQWLPEIEAALRACIEQETSK